MSDLNVIVERLLAERANQVARGYDAHHDDEHTKGEIVFDAKWGALSRLKHLDCNPNGAVEVYKQHLLEAAAMIVSELERLERVKKNKYKDD